MIILVQFIFFNKLSKYSGEDFISGTLTLILGNTGIFGALASV